MNSRAGDYASIDLSTDNAPDLAILAEEVHRTNWPRLLCREDEELAVVMSMHKGRQARGRAKPVTEDDDL